MTKFKLLSLFILFCAGQSFAQDKLLFLNGKELNGSVLNVTKYELTFKDDKNKELVIDNYRLFSYTKSNQSEVLLYKYDTLEGNFLKEKDMKMFVYGEREAHQSYHSNVTKIGSLLAGGAAGFMMQKDQSFVYVAAPLIVTTITLPFGTKVRQRKLKNSDYLKEDEYLRGYERVARSKRTQSALKFSILGTGLGFLTGLIVNN